jgi:hypothetical protein
MAKVMRQRPRVVAIIRKLVARRVPKHVRMNLERKVRGVAGSLDHPKEPSC